MRQKLSLVLSVCFLLATAPQAGLSQDIEQAVRLEEKDYFRHNVLSRSYSESWFYLLECDANGGPILFLNFIYTNMGLMSGMTGVEVVVTEANSAPRYFRQEARTSDYQETRTSREMAFKNASLSGLPPDNHRVSVNLEGLSLDARFLEMVPGFRLGDGKTPLGNDPDDYVWNAVTIPRARVEGTLTIDGTEQSISGWAYAEHSYQTITSNRYSRRWHTLRMHNDDYSLIMLDMEPTKRFASSNLRFIALTDKDGVLVTSTNFDLEANHSKPDVEGRPVPTQFDVNLLSPGFDLVGSAVNEGPLDRYVMADHLNKSGAFAVKAFAGNPVFYRSTSECSFRLTLDGVETNLTGDAVSEVLILD